MAKALEANPAPGSSDETALIRLQQGDYRMDIAPALGGSIAGLWWRGHPLLRQTPASAGDAMATAMFVMAPFANRIANGRFNFAGRDVVVRPNYPGEAHPLHGMAWLAPWRIDEASTRAARLSFAHAAAAWPWRFRCVLSAELSDNGALFALSVTNEDDTPMPASIGFHPWFVRHDDSAIKAQVDGYWRADDAVLPVEHVSGADIIGLDHGAALRDAPCTDQCYTGWNGRLTIAGQGFEIDLTASPELGFLHLYLPRDRPVFCAEPVTAMPDAFNHGQGSGLRVLPSGETLSVWMRIAARTKQS